MGTPGIEHPEGPECSVGRTTYLQRSSSYKVGLREDPTLHAYWGPCKQVPQPGRMEVCVRAKEGPLDPSAERLR